MWFSRGLKLFLTLCFSLSLVNNSNAAKILGVFHFPGRSQHVLGAYLLKELAARGHQVTMLSPFPNVDKPLANYTDVNVDGGLHAYMKSSAVNQLLTGGEMNIIQKLSIIPPAFQHFGQLFIESPELKEFLNSGAEFDLVILLFNMNEAMLGIGHHFNAPTIGFCTVGATQLINHIFANPSPYSMVSNFFMSNIETFWDRVVNSISTFAFQMMQQLWSIPRQSKLLERHFPNAPPLEELMDEMRIVLMNSHPAIEGSIPYMPNMIQIGGFHSSTPDPLPAEFKTFLDSASEGVILLSFGSNIRPSSFPKERIEAILKNLGSLDQKVIFKYDGDIKNVPKNMLISKWVPQTSILAHKNVELFITHSGLGGTAEAIYNAVPMICIPFFGDQHKNAEDTIKKGYGIKMNIDELDDGSLVRNVKEVLSNPMYKLKIAATADFYRSQPMKPLDKAIYWVEHVIKHKGSKHFPKSIGRTQWLYEYLLLDVLACIGLILLMCFLVMYCVFQIMYYFICRVYRVCVNKDKSSKDIKNKRKHH